MSRLRDLCNIYCVVRSTPNIHIYYTKVVADTLLIRITDGRTLWKLDLNPQNLESQSKTAGVEMEQFLKLIRNSLESGKNEIVVTADGHCTLSFGPKTKKLEFKLFKADEEEAKTALCDTLFYLVEKTKDQQKQLEKAAKTIDSLKQHTPNSALFDLNDVQSGRAMAKMPPKQPGMSVINPGSRRRKRAKGVEFD